MNELLQSYERDVFAQDIIAPLSLDPNSNPSCSLENGLLKFKSRLYVGTVNETRIKIIKALHTLAVGGHSRQKGCLHQVNTLFYWPHMKNDVLQFVRTSDVCQRRKSENMPYPCLLQPIPVPTQAWSHLTMDFIEQLPLSKGFTPD